jgi:hypothetical protein
LMFLDFLLVLTAATGGDAVLSVRIYSIAVIDMFRCGVVVRCAIWTLSR